MESVLPKPEMNDNEIAHRLPLASADRNGLAKRHSMPRERFWNMLRRNLSRFGTRRSKFVLVRSPLVVGVLQLMCPRIPS
jgi:hypothetical protein